MLTTTTTDSLWRVVRRLDRAVTELARRTPTPAQAAHPVPMAPAPATDASTGGWATLFEAPTPPGVTHLTIYARGVRPADGPASRVTGISATVDATAPAARLTIDTYVVADTPRAVYVFAAGNERGVPGTDDDTATYVVLGPVELPAVAGRASALVARWQVPASADSTADPAAHVPFLLWHNGP